MLSWLDPDREQAGKKYRKIQTRLIDIFSCHGCTEPEALADETIDRVSGKIDWLMANYVGEPIRYFCGVARNILKEYWKHRLPNEPTGDQHNERDEDDERKYECLDKCMAELTSRSQSIVLDYYQDEGRTRILSRKQLAEAAGITLQALRLRVFHIRAQLAKCMQECIARSSER